MTCKHQQTVETPDSFGSLNYRNFTMILHSIPICGLSYRVQILTSVKLVRNWKDFESSINELRT